MPENFENQMEKLQAPTEDERKAKEFVEQKKAIDRIIRGVNDTFIKEYNYPDINIAYTIKLKAPNAIEIGKIQAMMSAYLGGMNNYASDYMLTVYQTLATLRVVGIDVPKELEKDEDIYNLDIIYEIGVDFQRWLENFRF
jgi:hypothetical protein